MRQIFRSPRVQFLIDRLFSFVLLELACLSCPLGNNELRSEELNGIYDIFLILLVLERLITAFLEKKDRWRRHQPFELPSIYAIIFLLLGNWYGLAETDFFAGRLWLHLITYTLPLLVIYAWNYRKNFLVAEA